MTHHLSPPPIRIKRPRHLQHITHSSRECGITRHRHSPAFAKHRATCHQLSGSAYPTMLGQAHIIPGNPLRIAEKHLPTRFIAAHGLPASANRSNTPHAYTGILHPVAYYP